MKQPNRLLNFFPLLLLIVLVLLAGLLPTSYNPSLLLAQEPTTLPDDERTEPAQPITTVQPPDRPQPRPTPNARQAELPPLPLPPPRDGIGRDDDEDDSGSTSSSWSGVPCNAAARVDRAPRFMSLPFPADPQMEVFHGWHYTHNNQPQCGIDYGKRDANGNLMGFPVLAVADGEACADSDTAGSGCVSGFGDRVLIRHTIDGETYYTYYGHLESIDPTIPIGSRSNTVGVLRGQVIGYAGDTGTFGGSIHLHFGVAAPSFGWYDPYDVYAKAVFYPDPLGQNELFSGTGHFWTTNPPSSSPSPDVIGGPEASLPADSLTAGVIDISAWTEILGRESGVVEIWINGERRGVAPFGPDINSENSIFSWEWDTTQERNGPHRIRLVAFGEDSRAKPTFTATESQQAVFLVSVQNPLGFVETPAVDDLVSGKLQITGWANVENSAIKTVEIWINGVRRGEATYGRPNRGAGGDFGFTWEWDTTTELDGTHEVIVRAVADNGGRRDLPPRFAVEEQSLLITIRNSESVDKWSIR